MATDLKDAVPLRQVARRLSVDNSQVYRWSTDGIKGHVLAAFTVNGRRYTCEKDLATFLKAVGYQEVAK